jgi:hypothetical protein
MIDLSNEKRMISTREMSTDSGGRALGSPDTDKNDVARALVHLNEAITSSP